MKVLISTTLLLLVTISGIIYKSNDIVFNTLKYKTGVIVKIYHIFGGDLEVKNNRGKSLFQKAISNDNKEVFQYLIKAKANLDTQDTYGITPLMSAIVLKKNEYAFKLIDNGCDLNLHDIGKTSALHFAITGGNIEVAKYLIEKGAKINTPDVNGDTPLSAAVRGGYLSLVEGLVKRNVNIDFQDKFGMSALLEAVQLGKKDSIKFLLKSGANAVLVNKKNKNIYDLAKENLDKQIYVDLKEICEKDNLNCPPQQTQGNSLEN